MISRLFLVVHYRTEFCFWKPLRPQVFHPPKLIIKKWGVIEKEGGLDPSPTFPATPLLLHLRGATGGGLVGFFCWVAYWGLSESGCVGDIERWRNGRCRRATVKWRHSTFKTERKMHIRISAQSLN